jgi:hypothetical protein
MKRTIQLDFYLVLVLDLRDIYRSHRKRDIERGMDRVIEGHLTHWQLVICKFMIEGIREVKAKYISRVLLSDVVRNRIIS